MMTSVTTGNNPAWCGDMPWYGEVPPRHRLVQGELLHKCPVVQWKPIEWQKNPNLADYTDFVYVDVVVMTQDCDLGNVGKTENVTLCPQRPLAEYKELYFAEKTAQRRAEDPNAKPPNAEDWKGTYNRMRAGFVFPLALLSEQPPLVQEQRVVDFKEAFCVPLIFLSSWLQEQGSQRVALLPPYREYLSQAYARYYMRVGLPVAP